MVDDVNRAINETALRAPEIADHINESLVRLESALTIFGVASMVMLCLCVFLCIFNMWAQCQFIYGTKKILIVNSNQSEKHIQSEAGARNRTSTQSLVADEPNANDTISNDSIDTPKIKLSTPIAASTM